jgi:hypothetical protein
VIFWTYSLYIGNRLPYRESAGDALRFKHGVEERKKRAWRETHGTGQAHTLPFGAIFDRLHLRVLSLQHTAHLRIPV